MRYTPAAQGGEALPQRADGTGIGGNGFQQIRTMHPDDVNLFDGYSKTLPE